MGDHKLEVPEWGGYIILRRITVEEAFDIKVRIAALAPEVAETEAALLMIAAGVKRPHMTPEQARVFLRKSPVPFTAVVKAITTLNGFTKEAAEAAEDAFRGGN